MRKLIIGLAAVAVVAGCGSSTTADPTGDRMAASSPREDACVEVRAGVASYNAQDLESVQPHFARAVVFAQKYAEQSSSKEADDLLEAVRFFADVPPANYSANAASSRKFEKFKAITLGDCVDTDQDNSGEESPAQQT